MDRILIVDGSNLLFQMFYGMPARIVNRDGKAIQGTLGFVGALRKIIRMVQPTHLAVLFDGECDNGRTQLDEAYKANRTDYSQVPEEESPFSQLPDVYAALDYMGIPHVETTDCETDDWIAGYALTYGPENEMVISSFDSDFFQLITENVRILRYRGDRSVLCGCTYLQEKLGIAPAQYAAFKSLTGDHADNIKGADKIGPKTAAQLLHQFGTLEGILAGAQEITKPSIRESVIRNTPRLRTNYTLIHLNAGAPLPFSKEALTFTDTGLTTGQILQGIGLR